MTSFNIALGLDQLLLFKEIWWEKNKVVDDIKLILKVLLMTKCTLKKCKRNLKTIQTKSVVVCNALKFSKNLVKIVKQTCSFFFKSKFEKL